VINDGCQLRSCLPMPASHRAWSTPCCRSTFKTRP